MSRLGAADERERRPSPIGRELEVVEGGDLKGLPVFMQHGGNVSRQLPPPLVVYAQSHGIRLIGYNRPGYDGSTPHPGRTIADAAADVAVIANRLGLERFGVWGISAGGDPALACAALLPRRVVAAASLAGLAPHAAEGLAWFAGMGEANAAAFRLQLSNPRVWEVRQRVLGANLARATPTQVRESLRTLLSDADRKVLTDEFAGYPAACSHEAFRLGMDGTVDRTYWCPSRMGHGSGLGSPAPTSASKRNEGALFSLCSENSGHPPMVGLKVLNEMGGLKSPLRLARVARRRAPAERFASPERGDAELRARDAGGPA